MSATDEDLVVLLDEAGRTIGQAPREEVHGTDTPLHLAFSCYLFDQEGRLLLTRRAVTKRSWPGVWTNSVCGHPRPGEEPEDAVARRVAEELGLAVRELRLVLPQFRYRAVDAAGVVENEVCPVWVGTAEGELRADPEEVMETAWVDWETVVALAEGVPAKLSPWSALQIPQLARRLEGVGAP
jgi:isopentenyl-diphosphate delta-isomerase, type 1